MGDPAAAILLAVTLALFAWVGFHCRDGARNLEQYITARGTRGPTVLGLSFFASGMGGWILFAPPEVGAVVGLVAVAGYAVGAAAPLLAFALLGRRIRAVVPGGHGLTEFIRLRFGRLFHAYVVGISILYMLVFVTAELTAMGALAAIVSGLDARVAILALAGVTLAYTAYGGLVASIRTDHWQAWLVLVLVAIGVVAIFADQQTPGRALTRSGLLAVDRVGMEAAITLIVAIIAANLFHNGYWQRVWAAENNRALDGGAALGMVTTLPVVAVAGLLGIIAAGAGLELGDPPAPFFALVSGLPRSMNLVVLVLGVSLVASSVDTLESGLAALVVAERPRMSLRAARVVTVVLMVPAIIVALQGYSVLRLFLIADVLCAATLVPAMLALWSRATSGAVLAGAVGGLTATAVPGWVSTGSLVEGVRRATFPGAIPTLPPFAAAVAASTVVAVGVSLFSRRVTDMSDLASQVPVLTDAER